MPADSSWSMIRPARLYPMENFRWIREVEPLPESPAIASSYARGEKYKELLGVLDPDDEPGRLIEKIVPFVRIEFIDLARGFIHVFRQEVCARVRLLGGDVVRDAFYFVGIDECALRIKSTSLPV